MTIPHAGGFTAYRELNCAAKTAPLVGFLTHKFISSDDDTTLKIAAAAHRDRKVVELGGVGRRRGQAPLNSGAQCARNDAANSVGGTDVHVWALVRLSCTELLRVK
jgi:hypothetical protein